MQTLVVSFAFLYLLVLENCSAITVKTKSGEIEGKDSKSLFDKRPFHSFRGIPYAKPPIGDLRFKPPQKTDSWTRPLKALDYGSVCTQLNADGKTIGSEDCLFVNVFTPNIANVAKLPVVVYIHGGGWSFLSSNQIGPEIIMDENIVLVTFNYRLGIFGFLQHEDINIDGNMGLKDQNLVLQWVQENIEAFGGDKSRVTLMGHSAGSASTNFHLLAEKSNKLFQQAFMGGGNVLAPWSVTKLDHVPILTEAYARSKLVDAASVATNDLKDWLKFAPADELVGVGMRTFYVTGTSEKEMILPWAPVIEKANEHSILDKQINEYLKQTNDKNIMVVTYSADAIYFTVKELLDPSLLKSFNDRFAVQMPMVSLNYNFTRSDQIEAMKEIRDFYFGTKPIDKNTLTEYVDLMTDIEFDYSIHKVAHIQAEKSTGKCFFMRFAVVYDDLNESRVLLNANAQSVKGSAHVDDTNFIFFDENRRKTYENIKPNSPQSKAILLYRAWIANFVKFGDPSPNGHPIKHLPIDTHNFHYVDMTNDGVKAGVNLKNEMINFWNSFILKHRQLFV